MNNITKSTLTEMLERPVDGLAVTIYAPTHRAASPPHMTEDQIRLKNLTRNAMEQLQSRADGEKLAEQLQAHYDKLLDDRSFWEDQTEGLLICADNSGIHMFHLPIDTEEYVAVDNEYHLASLCGLLNDNREYYVLTVGQQEPALLRGDMYGLRETNVDLPETLQKGLRIDQNETEKLGSADGATSNGGWANGQGGNQSPHEDDRMQFWRMIDKIVNENTPDKLPMILAGTESEAVEYRNQSKYPKITDGMIQGSFGGAKPHQLFDKALEIIRSELVESAHADQTSRYEQMAGANPDRVARDADSIREAAQNGRVDTLLVVMNRMTADTVRDNMHEVPKITFPENSESARDFQQLVADTLKQSGEIVGLMESEMPERGRQAVAILRY